MSYKKSANTSMETRSKRSRKKSKEPSSSEIEVNSLPKSEKRKYINDDGHIIDLRPPTKPPEVKAASKKPKTHTKTKALFDGQEPNESADNSAPIVDLKCQNKKSVASPLKTKTRKRNVQNPIISKKIKDIETVCKKTQKKAFSRSASPALLSAHEREVLLDSVSDGQVYWATSHASKYLKLDRHTEKQSGTPDFGQQVDAFFGNPENSISSLPHSPEKSRKLKSPSCKLPLFPLPRSVSIPRLPQSMIQEKRLSAKQRFEEVLDNLRTKSIESMISSTKDAEEHAKTKSKSQENTDPTVAQTIKEITDKDLSLSSISKQSCTPQPISSHLSTKNQCDSTNTKMPRFHSTPIRATKYVASSSQSRVSDDRGLNEPSLESSSSPRLIREPLPLSLSSMVSSLVPDAPSFEKVNTHEENNGSHTANSKCNTNVSKSLQPDEESENQSSTFNNLSYVLEPEKASSCSLHLDQMSVLSSKKSDINTDSGVSDKSSCLQTHVIESEGCFSIQGTAKLSVLKLCSQSPDSHLDVSQPNKGTEQENGPELSDDFADLSFIDQYFIDALLESASKPLQNDNASKHKINNVVQKSLQTLNVSVESSSKSIQATESLVDIDSQPISKGNVSISDLNSSDLNKVCDSTEFTFSLLSVSKSERKPIADTATSNGNEVIGLVSCKALDKDTAVQHNDIGSSDDSFQDDELDDIFNQINAKTSTSQSNSPALVIPNNFCSLPSSNSGKEHTKTHSASSQNSLQSRSNENIENTGCSNREANSSSGLLSEISLGSHPQNKALPQSNYTKKENLVDPENPIIPTKLSYVRCLVIEVQTQFRTIPSSNQIQQPEKMLRVYDEQTQKELVAFLRGSWLRTEVRTGDYVNLIGKPDNKGFYIIDDTKGFLILHPNILISTTHLASSFDCLRRAVLSDRVRSSSDGDATSMVLGNFFHELLQECLLADRFDTPFLNMMSRKIVLENSEALYLCGKDESYMLELIETEINQLQAWAETYLGTMPKNTATFHCASSRVQTNLSNTPTLSISRVLEVEESIWSPMFGLKGKVDASVQTKQDSSTHLSLLEFKTGRVNHPIAHRAQAILYTLMMSERYQTDVTHAWLYYLKGTLGKDMMTRIDSIRDELCSIMQARNKMTTYIHGAKSAKVLPEMIKNLHVCQYCPVLNACTIFHRAIEGGNAQSSQLGEQFESRTRHLTSLHLSFFRHWENLLTLEEGKIHQARQQIWCLPSTERSKSGLCFGSMVVIEEAAATANPPPDCVPSGNNILDIENLAQPSQWHDYKFVKANLASNLTLPNSSAPPQSLAERLATSEFLIPNQDSLTRTNIGIGDPIVVSTDTQPGHVQHVALAIGFIKEIHQNYITVSLDRRLRGPPMRTPNFNTFNCQSFYGESDLSSHPKDNITSNSKTKALSRKVIYRIDKDELTTGMLLVRNNLVELMAASTGPAAHLRVLVIDLVAPSFRSIPRGLDSQTMNFSQSSQIPSTLTSSSMISLSEIDSSLSDMNADQKHAIKTVVSAKDYTLILGMPGTGKTTTIARMIQLLVQLGSSVLIAAHTHSAVDTILCKLHDLGLRGILRLGNKNKVHPTILRYTVEGRRIDDSGAYRPLSSTSLRQIYETTPIVATTCLGISHVLFQRRQFDYCIIDEASQVTLPICVGPLRFASRFVLVGDHYQLPPLVRNSKAKKGGLATSLFKRLSESHPRAVVYLRHQYRMNQDIMDIANHLVYQHALRCGTHAIATSNLRLGLPSRLNNHLHNPNLTCPGLHDFSKCWIKQAIDPNRRVVFLNTDPVPGYDEKIGENTSNPIEVELISQIVRALQLSGVESHQIAVISPYRTQLTLLTTAVPDVEVLTVDRSQGRDKDCVIVSLVRSNLNNSVGDLLRDWRRINVAFTRARHKLVIVGSASTFHVGGGAVLSELVDFVTRRNWIYNLPKAATELHCLPTLTEINSNPDSTYSHDEGNRHRIHPLASRTLEQCPTLQNVSQELFGN